MEYHNVTWTWLDFLMAVKSKSKDSLISQAIKQKLAIKSSAGAVRRGLAAAAGKIDDKEKTKLLLGDL